MKVYRFQSAESAKVKELEKITGFSAGVLLPRVIEKSIEHICRLMENRDQKEIDAYIEVEFGLRKPKAEGVILRFVPKARA